MEFVSGGIRLNVMNTVRDILKEDHSLTTGEVKDLFRAEVGEPAWRQQNKESLCSTIWAVRKSLRKAKPVKKEIDYLFDALDDVNELADKYGKETILKITQRWAA